MKDDIRLDEDTVQCTLYSIPYMQEWQEGELDLKEKLSISYCSLGGQIWNTKQKQWNERLVCFKKKRR